jgi:hypothetical protein
MPREALDPRSLQELHRLNSAFLTLLRHCRDTPLAARLDRRSGLLDRVVSLDPGQSRVLCTTSSALFSLQLDFPGALAPNGVAEEIITCELEPRDRLVREFGLVVCGFAWHLSQTSPLAASILLGWTRSVASELAGFALADVVRANLACTPAVRLRMCRHPRFWPDLIRDVVRGRRRDWAVRQTWSAQFIGRGPGP